MYESILLAGRVVGRGLACATILFASVCVAKPTTAPATKPTSFPTPAEVIEKLKAASAEQAKLIQVAYIDLNDTVAEAPPDFSWTGSNNVHTLHSLLERLRQAKEDKEVEAVLVTLNGASMSLAQAQELRDALADITADGKKTFVYADAYDTTTYILATGASDVCLLAGGDMEMPGVGIETMFYKGLFDKVGVKADYVQIGEFKGAEEPFTRTGASEPLKGELTRLTDALYKQIVSGIAEHRKLPEAKVSDAIDQAILTGADAKKRGLVDHLTDADDLRELLADKLGGEVDLVQDYGLKEEDEIDLSSPFAIFSLLGKKPEASDKKKIAIIYADGVIVDGEAGGGLLDEGGQVGSANIRRAVRIADRDDTVKAVVIRIDSPGGSALASEVMWQSVRRLAEDKPVIISIGSMAASGGYYLASAGDVIYADPSAIVGSIGVVGGKFVLKDLYDKIGLSTEIYTRGGNADLFSSNQPFTDKQRAMVTNWMTETYKQFTSRILETRGDKIKDIDKIARGRIFLAADAKALGMVDELGGLDDAIASAAEEAELEPGSYEIRVIPAPRTLMDLLRGEASETASPIRTKQMPLGSKAVQSNPLLSLLGVTLDAPARRLLGQQLQTLQLLQQRPVLLVAPYVVTVR